MTPRRTGDGKPGWLGLAAAVGGLHVLGLLGMLLAAHDHPTLLGMGFLAYALGLRHAFDADHITAIDNTVRKLLQQHRNPSGVGFYFSLGHSTVVLLLALATALSARWVQRELPGLRQVGSLLGTAVSGGFLLFIGLINLAVLADICRVFARMRRGDGDGGEMERLLLERGLVARFARPLFRLVGRAWHVYPLGFLFGLGFDTASEVALLATSALAASNDVPLTGIAALPVLFAAGMSLMDTADGLFMTTAYRWAFATPLRKVYYNLTVTGLAVASALVVGAIELAQVAAARLGLAGGLWTWLQGLDLGGLGYLLTALFLLTWLLSYGAWKLLRIEERWSS